MGNIYSVVEEGVASYLYFSVRALHYNTTFDRWTKLNTLITRRPEKSRKEVCQGTCKSMCWVFLVIMAETHEGGARRVCDNTRAGGKGAMGSGEHLNALKFRSLPLHLQCY